MVRKGYEQAQLWWMLLRSPTRHSVACLLTLSGQF